MKATQVKELMIPLSDYVTVQETDTLGTAISNLKKAQKDTQHTHSHRAVLVLGSDGEVIGKLGYRGILKALEPKYRQFEHANDTGEISLSRFGFNQEFLLSLVDQLSLWDESMEELVSKASKRIVKDIMYTPGKGEYVGQDTCIAEAVHQFILGCHQSLLVLDNKKVVGVIRLVDIFDLIGSITE